MSKSEEEMSTRAGLSARTDYPGCLVFRRHPEQFPATSAAPEPDNPDLPVFTSGAREWLAWHQRHVPT